LEKRNIGTRFTTEKKISQILPTPKDKLLLFQSEGIYKVECLCGKCYIGQTGGSIQCRLKEHSRAIKQYDKEKSALAEHKFEDEDHTLDLEKTVVLAKTSKYHQRLIREAIEIRKNPNNFNRDQGVELSSTWNSVIRPCTHPPTNFSHRATPTTPTTNPTGTTPTTNHINSPTRNRPNQFIYKLRRR
jgi:predicted GIY-YIG superfamily endonuclease